MSTNKESAVEIINRYLASIIKAQHGYGELGDCQGVATCQEEIYILKAIIKEIEDHDANN